jgi:hypothetical protein
MPTEIDFNSWYVDLSSTEYREITLSSDADELVCICHEDDWYLSNTNEPSNPNNPFPVLKGQTWSLVLGRRRTKAQTLVAYARSKSIDGAILHCYVTVPPDGV